MHFDFVRSYRGGIGVVRELGINLPFPFAFFTCHTLHNYQAINIYLKESWGQHSFVPVQELVPQHDLERTVVEPGRPKVGGFLIVRQTEHQLVGHLKTEQGADRRVPSIRRSQGELVVEQEVRT